MKNRPDAITTIMDEIETANDSIQEIMDEELEHYGRADDEAIEGAAAEYVTALNEAQKALQLAMKKLSTAITKNRRKYMVLTVLNDETGTNFFSNWTDTQQYRMDAECGFGAYTEVYEWNDDRQSYDLI